MTKKKKKRVKPLYCPRCKTREVYDYGERFECMKCLLEFDKKDFYRMEDDEILSIKEKLKISKVFKDMMDEANEDIE
jgi:hypothetical protein